MTNKEISKKFKHKYGYQPTSMEISYCKEDPEILEPYSGRTPLVHDYCKICKKKYIISGGGRCDHKD